MVCVLARVLLMLLMDISDEFFTQILHLDWSSPTKLLLLCFVFMSTTPPDKLPVDAHSVSRREEDDDIKRWWWCVSIV